MKIAIFGTVGAGKTTISECISKEMGYKIFPEPVENNPYFKEYYSDMKNTVFKMQIYMLTVRSIQLTKAKNLDNTIFDRTILEDPIFVDVNHALGIMNDVDFQTYKALYENVFTPFLKNKLDFDFIIYLRTSTDKAIERIKERGRVDELKTDRLYWETLNHFYEEFYEQNKNKFNFLVIDSDIYELDEKMKIIKNKINKLKY